MPPFALGGGRCHRGQSSKRNTSFPGQMCVSGPTDFLTAKLESVSLGWPPLRGSGEGNGNPQGNNVLMEASGTAGGCSEARSLHCASSELRLACKRADPVAQSGRERPLEKRIQEVEAT